jgi:hypothetical protein
MPPKTGTEMAWGLIEIGVCAEQTWCLSSVLLTLTSESAALGQLGALRGHVPNYHTVVTLARLRDREANGGRGNTLDTSRICEFRERTQMWRGFYAMFQNLLCFLTYVPQNKLPLKLLIVHFHGGSLFILSWFFHCMVVGSIADVSEIQCSCTQILFP